MQSLKTIALWGVLAPCLALVLSSASFAQASTPSERAQTQQLNQNITDANAAAVAQSDQANADYQAQQQQYQEQLRQYKANRQNYEERSSRYYAARDRYVSSHARYHRYGWPARYEHSLVVYKAELLGARVQTYNGHTVGRVEELALANGHVDAVRVALDYDRGDVWIESADLRFDPNRRVVMTNLDRHDLYEMTHETY
jgi:multidrug efflux pump subunit AcrA (membrane-fusion protein)